MQCFPHSQQAFEAAKRLMPGGVSSPVRAFRSVGGHPLFIQRANGAYLWDVDGNRYIDYVNSWGPAILGHAHPDVIAAIQKAAENGTSFGAPSLLESALAERVIAMVPSVERVRFVNSGTEACMSAIRLARAFTGRSRIIKFAGCYHGHGDMFLVKAGSGVATLGLPDSPGVPQGTAELTLTAEFNDLDSVRQLLTQYPEEVAAIFVEPVVGNMGCVPPEPGFLQGLRALADEFGALLLFDEVMTGFRVARGGAQERYGVRPDITTLGKIIGGGLPVGAYGGRDDIMAMVAPEGPMYQAGTLSGNPLAMTAGLETLARLNDGGFYEALEGYAKLLCEGMRVQADTVGVPVQITQVGSMVTVFFTDAPVTNYTTAMAGNREHFKTFFWTLLEQGIYLPPSPFESWFFSIAHTPDDLAATLKATSVAFEKVAAAHVG